MFSPFFFLFIYFQENRRCFFFQPTGDFNHFWIIFTHLPQTDFTLSTFLMQCFITRNQAHNFSVAFHLALFSKVKGETKRHIETDRFQSVHSVHTQVQRFFALSGLFSVLLVIIHDSRIIWFIAANLFL